MAPLAASSLVLPLDALVRSLMLNSQAGYAVCLGAGAAVTSGIPDVVTCIWRWKRAIFVSNNADYQEHDLDIEPPYTRAFIQEWLDQQGKYPPEGAAAEYCVYIEACYPIEADRSLYFQQWASQAKPSLISGYVVWPKGYHSFHLDNEL